MGARLTLLAFRSMSCTRTVIIAANVTYYRCGPDYYRRVYSGGSVTYVVVSEPAANAEPLPAAAEEIYVYPKAGQDEDQQNLDRYECHQWAVDQTGFDPSRSPSSTAGRSDYDRAIKTCLEARGYTVN